MIWEFLCSIDESDNLALQIAETEKSGQTALENAPQRLETNVKFLLKKSGIQPNRNVLDLLHFGHFVYAIDRNIPRHLAFDGWERGFKVNIPVSNPSLWISLEPRLKEMLGFLTGDHWELNFREAISDSQPKSEPLFRHQLFDAKAIALLSGGLDSFVGALDLLENQIQGVFVSHYGRGGVVKSIQTRVYELLGKYYPNSFEHFQFFIHPPKNITGKTESTSRSRSFLFLSLGVTVANAYGNNIPLYISENGLISLNVPMTKNRIGSLSTRTTHPLFLEYFQKLLDELEIDVRVQNPFQFMTKGEMLKRIRNQDVLREGTSITMSCSQEAMRRYKGISPYTHCGYCLPCLVRRAAIKKAGFEDTTLYSKDINEISTADSSEGHLKRAVQMAISRSEKSSPLFEIKKTGRLPGTTEDILNYADVYKRGLLELKDFI